MLCMQTVMECIAAPCTPAASALAHSLSSLGWMHINKGLFKNTVFIKMANYVLSVTKDKILLPCLMEEVLKSGL